MSTIDFTHLKQLAVFNAVVESGSFAAAARKLSTSRSRVSEQVSALEKDLGVRLMQRSTRQLTLTQEGNKVLEQARKLPGILHEVEGVLAPEKPKGRVAITMNQDIAVRFFLPLMARFREAYPDIELDLIIDDARVDIIDQQIDLAIRIGVPKDESLVARVMHEERFSIYASPDYLQRNGRPDTLEDLKKHHWLMLYQRGHDVLRFRQADGFTELYPDTYERCNSPLVLQQMVVQGLGIGCLLPTTVKTEIETGQLLPLLPDVTTESLVFSLVYPSRKHIPLRTRVLIDFILAARMFNPKQRP